MRLFDGCCKAGGATRGYQNAGFEVVGCDIEPQPNYVGDDFICDDVISVLWLLVQGQSFKGWRLADFDGFHVSPPCHAHTTLRHRTGKQYVDIIDECRQLLRATGKPYVIENVPGAPLENPIVLCGSSFGLGANGRQLRRHRLFECSFPVMAPPCQHSGDVVGVYGTGGGGQMTRGFKAQGVAEAREALGTPWMTLAECAQAIPPMYTEHIGEYMMRALTMEVAAA
jgi:DNA (cytosine-5)-methyltransferase 1